jgi:amino acid transporter
VTVTAVAEFGSGFVAALFGVEATPGFTLLTVVALLLIAFAFNYSGTRMLARIARIGLAAELIGVIALGVYLLLFRREQPFSIFFDSLGAGGDQSYVATFLAASLSGLFLFYGFEACGDVAEEVADPTRRIPRAMILTIVVGGVSGLVSYAGYVLAALRQRIKGWRPAGLWNLGSWGLLVNVVALAYGVFAIILLLQPADTDVFLDRWIVLIGLLVVGGSGLLYLLIAKPDRHSGDVPEGDAIEVATHLRQIRTESQRAGSAEPVL